MKIGFLSPVNNVGCTTLSILIADTISKVSNHKVLLSHDSTNNIDMNTYLKIADSKDMTRSVTQIIKLLEVQAIQPNEIYDYTIFRDSLNILSNDTGSISKLSANKLTQFILDSTSESEICILDITEDLNSINAIHTLQKMDYIMVVIDQNDASINEVVEWMKSDSYKAIDKGNIAFVINRYDETVSSAREVSKKLGVKHKIVTTFPYSPWVVKCGNKGILHGLVKDAIVKDHRIFEVHFALKAISLFIATQLDLHLTWDK